MLLVLILAAILINCGITMEQIDAFQEMALRIISVIVVILAAIVDPTTKGVEDSDYAKDKESASEDVADVYARLIYEDAEDLSESISEDQLIKEAHTLDELYDDADALSKEELDKRETFVDRYNKAGGTD